MKLIEPIYIIKQETRKKQYLELLLLGDEQDVKVRTIYRDLEELKHLIEYVGPSKGGYWKLLK